MAEKYRYSAELRINVYFVQCVQMALSLGLE